MSEDWAAVAREVNARAAELGLKQKELAESSGVSLATVREIQQNRIRRRRNPRTLEALSIALQWHPKYLISVLERRPTPETTELPLHHDAVLAALNTIVREIRGLRVQVGTLNKRLDSLVSSREGDHEEGP